ncbi:hypothetical protein NDU88_008295 [Pleurodeles waltl]|uniref:Reverse transcriptase domain-containing protein n=1 Tax=Pleurodeles waltl TaxID=8319 RepID=A0AAV7VW08_PLEWA|nr:hypothetical protein NDU88_008295 [Pleurodeles waltl]
MIAVMAGAPDHFERQVVNHDDNPFFQQIKLWKRYIDDILLVWTGTRDEAMNFVNWLNTANPFLNFTMTIAVTGNASLPLVALGPESSGSGPTLALARIHAGAPARLGCRRVR